MKTLLTAIAVMGLSLSPAFATELCEVNGKLTSCNAPSSTDYSKAMSGLAAAGAIDFIEDDSNVRWGLGAGFYHHEAGVAGAIGFNITERMNMKIYLASDTGFKEISGGIGITGGF